MACSCSSETILGCGCCCGNDDCAAPEASTGPQGPVGPTGPAGADGSDGINAFTVSTDTFVVPAVSSNVTIDVAEGTWVSPGQNLYIQTAGYYQAVSSTSTTITATNLGEASNAAPSTVIATNRVISPAGHAGVLVSPLPIADGGTGQASAALAFDALSPMSANGDLISRSGGSNVRIAAGTSGFILTAQGAGVLPIWAANTPAAANITGVLAIAKGGTGANAANTARANLSVPGLTDNNGFTGANDFDVLAATFSVTGGGSAILDIASSTSTSKLNDITGTTAVDAQNRRLEGSWTQTAKSKTVASGATFLAAAWADVETVVSTRSSTGTQTIELPVGTDDRIVNIVDAAGNAGTNNITLSRSGADLIIGSTSYLITNDYGKVSLRFYAATSTWIFN